MSKFFIKHPIIAIVISIVTVILGLLSLMRLPIEQYPDIVPPTIQLAATYPGADAQTVADSVASPIEMQMSGVDKMEYMYSSSGNNGATSLSVVFQVGTEPNMDQVLTYNRYGQATSQLPSEVAQMGVTIKKMTAAPLLVVSLVSPKGTIDPIQLANYAYVSLVDPLKRIDGVGDVQVYGAGRYAMRVWLDTVHMSAQGITIAEVQAAIQSQNTVNPSGQVGAEPAPDGQDFTYTIRTKGRLSTPEEFGNIVVRADDTQIIYLRDIARIELGSQTYNLSGMFDGMPSGAVAIFQSPGSNAIATVDAVKKELDEFAKSFPPDLESHVALDTTLSVRASIDEIETTLYEALALVVLVVFVFLQGWRATLIPSIAVIVSIVGTFIFFPLIGFTLNTICLMGMVLAIGLVVDDAIVVVEAIESHIERGLSPRQAAFAAMEEVSGPVVAIALVLSAVFLPTLLLPGITGTLFQQFAVTIAISVLISAFNALTLSPALAGIFLKPRHGANVRKSPLQWFYNGFNKVYNKSADGYANISSRLARKLWISIPLLIVISLLVIPVASKVPGGFLPEEDQGYLFATLQLQDAASLQRTAETVSKIDKLLRSNDNIGHVMAVSGLNLLTGVQSTNCGFFFVNLKPWDERKGKGQSAKELLPVINGMLAKEVREGVSFAFSPPAISGTGASGGITFILQDRLGNGVPFLAEQATLFCEKAQQRPEIAMAISTMMPAVPQQKAVVDTDRCFAQGVNVKDVNNLLQAYMGSMFINYITLYGQQWQVYIQAQAEDRTNIELLENFYIKNNKGVDVPLSALVDTEKIFGPEFIYRYDLYNAALIQINLTPGYSSAQGMAALEEIFDQEMPIGMGYGYSGMSYQEQKAQQGVSIVQVFLLSAIFVFLILAALYERWSLPLSIFMTVPISTLGAFAGLAVFNLELNLYAQIGLVMLIGLAAKNAILIVEFAVLELERGKELLDATISAARQRLRPIIMTSLAFILSCVPLAMASGSGAYARENIGIVVISGMLMSTVVGVFLIPCSFYFIMKLFRVKITKKHQGEDPDEVIAMKHLAADN